MLSKREISLTVKFLVVIVACIGVAVCAFWYPFSISLTAIGIIDVEFTQPKLIEFWVQLLFYWSASVPCFAVLVLYWRAAGIVRKDAAFKDKVVKILKRCTVILTADLAVFLSGNIVFMYLGWNGFAALYLLVFLLGVAFLIANIIFTDFVSRKVK